ncbi:hypothetical protein GCM10009128_11960 [Psychrosphaera haliotis]|uniref:PQQ-binding-like beta-propeller repeat protein n=1 Tax=Psychrosphaera haliotis TaxID=555083 RepID=UPI0031E120B4
MNNYLKLAQVLLFSSVVAACGGGGDSSSSGSESGGSSGGGSNSGGSGGSSSRLVWGAALPTTSFAYYSSPALSADEQTIYVGTAKNVRNASAGNDVMAAYDRNGNVKWQYTLPNAEEVRSSPVVHKGNIYFTVDKRTAEFNKSYRDLVALSSAGNEIWRKRVSEYGSQTGSGLTKVVATGDQIIYTGLDVLVFNADSGDKLFERLCNCSGRQDRFVNGALNNNGELVYYDEGRLLKLNLTTYEVSGEFDDIATFQGDLVLSSPAVDSNSNVYLGSEAGILYAFNDNLELLWDFRLTTPNVIEAPHIRSSVAIDESRETLYFGTKSNENSEFYALDMNDQSVKWKVSIPGDVYVSPTIGDNGNIYFASETDLLYAYTPTGTLAWQYDLKVNVTWSSPVIDSSGILYIGGLSEADLSSSGATGKVFAIQTDSTGLMTNTWAKIHRDNQNTGVAK